MPTASAYSGVKGSAKGNQMALGNIRNRLDSIYGSEAKLEQQENCTVVKQTTMANPFLPQDYIDELLESYTSEFAKQELYAEPFHTSPF